MKPIGPYSKTLQVGNMLFVSGQISPNATDNVAAQAKTVLHNLQQLVTDAGFTLSTVVQCSIFLTDMNDFKAVNSVYADYWKEPYPTRQTVEVSKLPAEAKIEISCIAVRGDDEQ